ncbi:MAG: hypothetical protein KDH20_08435 [Rhodocyclaceae bacterium]|nr:hypothetical protein [Rhodocyclaceae bacterium]
MKRFIRVVLTSAWASMLVFGPAWAESELNGSDVERQGTIESVDPTRSVIRIGGKSYQLDQNTRILIGARRVYGLSELERGALASYGTDSHGRMTAIQVLGDSLPGFGGGR